MKRLGEYFKRLRWQTGKSLHEMEAVSQIEGLHVTYKHLCRVENGQVPLVAMRTILYMTVLYEADPLKVMDYALEDILEYKTKKLAETMTGTCSQLGATPETCT